VFQTVPNSIPAFRGFNKPTSVYNRQPYLFIYLFKCLWSSTNHDHDLLSLATKSWIRYCISTCPYSSKTRQSCFSWVQNLTTGTKYDSVGQPMWEAGKRLFLLLLNAGVSWLFSVGRIIVFKLYWGQKWWWTSASKWKPSVKFKSLLNDNYLLELS